MQSLNLSTVGEALYTARQKLKAVSDAPPYEARRLLGALLSQNTSWLYTHAETPLSAAQQAAFQASLEKRLQGYPLAYIIGEWGFYHWDFIVNEHVLIPRPETELLVTQAEKWAKAQAKTSLSIVDVGTGSGIVGISLALLLPEAAVTAVDISPAALEIARQNARRLNADNIKFQQSDLLADVTSPFDLIAANLPYIAPDELAMLDVSQHEPHLALDGGPDGMALINQLLQQSRNHLTKDGVIFLEIGDQQGPLVEASARQIYPAADIIVLQDLNKRDRVVKIQLN